MANSSSTWTWEQDKAFEIALALYSHDNSEEKWVKLASLVPGNKTILEIKHHYQILLDDIEAIESGNVALPSYTHTTTPCNANHSTSPKKRNKESEWEARKGQPWTEEEHKQFLLGMEKYGKGDWKSIAKEFVKTRSATQVASHAQKYFKRQMKEKKDTKRWSIFDMPAPCSQGDGKSSGSSSSSSINEYTRKEMETKYATNDTKNQKVVEVQHLNPVINSLEYMSPPESCLVEHDFDIDLEFEMNLQECLSQLPP
ncbi:hypothetical protein BVRB_2g026510 [Beta vulgaris subsp. vulgaris]|uniref:transcription factor SRM1 n=1 Tax=Beta vulgaris subsp. vulgaris TaxID=3555 RepID=UPI00053FC0F1|nr:transcription factor SRM1 [Beta vulgaris subsp. vulgaris]KMT18513.1 hypothetical protein BVRB_2g026510 [Beta vulgaris subsp. vulgaris]